MTQQVNAYLSLGSNLGDRAGNIRQALAFLDSEPNLSVVAVSSTYETKPWGLLDQPNFLNIAVGVQTSLEPATLLDVAKGIEQEIGRIPTVRYGPRSIDIDILLYGDLVIDWSTPDLQIPHPRMRERAFVLVPLAEIAGALLHPISNSQIADLAASVDGLDGVTLWPETFQV
ncbi:MAG: 2-amino-4-hydroxy-6-hydroxymethyldihydropteridine diphosphokinase [Chloroflexi bacterium]|nr:2-amino-4-hydroxy-6-hydroxymethyldihydropteridine diphosphokinase [Chloroflexota bacterium]